MSGLDRAVEALAKAATQYLTVSSRDGATGDLEGPLAAVQEAASDLAGEVEDPAGSPLFAGWAAVPDSPAGL
jgi:hypothetical protein